MTVCTAKERGVAASAVTEGRRAPVDEDLVAAIYEAALLPERWRLLPDLLARRLGARAGVLRRRDGAAEPMADDAPADCHASVPVPAVPSMPDAAGWVLRLDGFDDAAAAATARERLRALAPHLARAVGIAHGQMLHESRLTVAALDQVGAGAAIIDDAGRVLAANARFADQLGLAGEPVGVPVRLGQRRDVLSLRTLVAGAIAGGIRGAMPVHDDAGACVAALHLLPVGGVAGGAAAGPAAALVLVATPRAASLPSAGLLRSLFGLTHAETEITRAIAAGQAIERIAQASATSAETVRSHLKRVFSKTGTTRQLELALLVRGFGLAGACVTDPAG